MNRLDGERGRNRTFNLLIKSQLLCQLSYAPDPMTRLVACGWIAVYGSGLQPQKYGIRSTANAPR